MRLESPQLKFSQTQDRYLALDMIQKLFLAERWGLVTQGMAPEMTSGMQMNRQKVKEKKEKTFYEATLVFLVVYN